MSVELSAMAELARRLLLPEQVAIDEVERDHARRRIEDAGRAGLLSRERVNAQKTRLAHARTRGDVRQALGAIPGGAAPSGLVAALRGATGLWFVAVGVQLLIWAMVMVARFQLIEPWWVWTLVSGPFLIGPLWWLTETYYRPERHVAKRPVMHE